VLALEPVLALVLAPLEALVELGASPPTSPMSLGAGPSVESKQAAAPNSSARTGVERRARMALPYTPRSEVPNDPPAGRQRC
jgi:hypothetical protein